VNFYFDAWVECLDALQVAKATMAGHVSVVDYFFLPALYFLYSRSTFSFMKYHIAISVMRYTGCIRNVSSFHKKSVY
jgi:hypothetical protein